MEAGHSLVTSWPEGEREVSRGPPSPTPSPSKSSHYRKGLRQRNTTTANAGLTRKSMRVNTPLSLSLFSWLLMTPSSRSSWKRAGELIDTVLGRVASRERAGKRGMGGKMAGLQVGSSPTASVVPVSDQVAHNTCRLQDALAFLLGQISLPASL